MSKIIDYTPNDDGTFTAVIKGVSLGNEETQALENGIPVHVDVEVHSPHRISDRQRRKIFALVRDIEDYTGTPMEFMRSVFQIYVEMTYGYREPISLATCDKKTASRIIEVILEWVFLEDIPLTYKTSDLLKSDRKFLYLATINRQCVICGKPKSDLAHRWAVGSGRNRRAINHTGNQVLALCRTHHNEQHDIGITSFNEKYHLTDSWVDVDAHINRMLKGQEVRK